jgi:hypothetical protein
MLVSDLIYAASRAAGILDLPQGQVAPGESSDALQALNLILDEWSARKSYVWSVAFTTHTLTPNHQPHLIGPSLSPPDFAAVARPVRIESASLILTTSTPNVDQPLNLRDAEWWANLRIKDLATTIPTDLYYQPDEPNGALYLWPVPTFAYGLRLETWTALNQFATVGDTFTAPPAYAQALILTLAERMCVWFGMPITPALAQQALNARRSVMTNNNKSPRISSADWGVGRGRPGGFNWYTGGPA